MILVVNNGKGRYIYIHISHSYKHHWMIIQLKKQVTTWRQRTGCQHLTSLLSTFSCFICDTVDRRNPVLVEVLYQVVGLGISEPSTVPTTNLCRWIPAWRTAPRLSRDPEASAESSAAMPESPRVLPPPSARQGAQLEGGGDQNATPFPKK